MLLHNNTYKFVSNQIYIATNYSALAVGRMKIKY